MSANRWGSSITRPFFKDTVIPEKRHETAHSAAPFLECRILARRERLRRRSAGSAQVVAHCGSDRHPGPERQSRLRLATSHLASRLSPQYSRSPHHIKYCPAGAPSPTVWTAISKDQLRTCIDTLRVQASGGANRVMLFPLIQSSAKVRFEPRPQKIGGTWVLIATHPSGQQEHIDPFESAKSHFFDTSGWGKFCDVTLTSHGEVQVKGVVLG